MSVESPPERAAVPRSGTGTVTRMEGTRLVLVRHGESVAQTDKIVGGHAGCRGLSPLGRTQAEALRDRLATTKELGDVAALYASVLPRAIETAQILAPALGHPEVSEDCDLCEHHPGEGDGLSWEEYEARYPLPDEGWHPDHRRDPGGETWREMGDRVARGLDKLVERHTGETVVVACHGGVIVQSMLRWVARGDFDDPRRADESLAWFHPHNTSITEWCYGRLPFGTQRLGWQLVRFNDHAHLAAL